MYRSDAASQPLTNVQYEAADPRSYAFNSQTALHDYDDHVRTKKSGKKLKWFIVALVLLACVILAAVLGGVLGSRHHNSSKNSDVSAASGSSNHGEAVTSGDATGSDSSIASVANNVAVLHPTATDANGNPLYPTPTGTASPVAPTSLANDSLSCDADSYAFNTTGVNVRTDHPRLIAPGTRWSCLPKLIENDYYLSYWNDTVFTNASAFYDMPPTNYSIDGGYSGSGVLDVSREVQLRLKHWGYAYKLTNDTKWVDRAWTELQTAAGNTSTFFGRTGNEWNTDHFLDVGEFTAAFGIAYDWFYDAWTDEQRTAIMWSIISLGLNYGIEFVNNESAWWAKVNGNWNCVCAGGLAMGAIAIAHDDPTGVAEQIINWAVPNLQQNCAQAPSSDGTWSETANYWYFGTYKFAETAASLLTATGSTQGLLDANPAFVNTSLYHMHVTGQQGLFAYGDTGPNKYTATANSLLFFGSQYDVPRYALFQRDRSDAPEPTALLYYDPQLFGDWWYGLELDHHFDNVTNNWAAMRSTWTDTNGSYIALKAGELTGHQTHGDLDAGDFVLDALGQRWAGEYGSGNYLAENYFSNETQSSERWWYYRKRTEGQNTLTFAEGNELVTGSPASIAFGSTGESQDAFSYTPSVNSTAFFTNDLSSFASDGSTWSRGIRFINGRTQVLLQDEVTSKGTVQWRVHTNATVEMSNNNQTATLTLGGQTLIAELQSPSGAAFFTEDPVRLSSDPTLDSGSGNQDQPNSGTVLSIALEAGTNTIAVLFNPQWPGQTTYATPAVVALADWSLTSHD